MAGLHRDAGPGVRGPRLQILVPEVTFTIDGCFPRSLPAAFWSPLTAEGLLDSIAVLLSLLFAGRVGAQVTRAERTDFQETSSHADVLAFLDSLGKVTGDMRIATLTTSPEGRRVPYVLAARPLVVGSGGGTPKRQARSCISRPTFMAAKWRERKRRRCCCAT